MVTAQLVKELRELTGAGMMDCKKALSETNGDLSKAVDVLREKGLASAAKKAGRVAAEGVVSSYVNADSSKGTLVELNCETDFVAINPLFVQLSKEICEIASENQCEDVQTIETLDYKFSSEFATVKDAIVGLVSKLGENISLRRAVNYSTNEGVVNTYIHGDGKIGVMVELKSENKGEEVLKVAKDICMQIAAANPLFLNIDSVDQSVVEKERQILKTQALNEGKPEQVVEKMVEGRIKKYYQEICLLEQSFVKDPDLTVTKFIENKSKELGSKIQIIRFSRFEKGEGIEKAEENFAEEVQKQINKGDK
ncbi:translation elongation factor Ts [Candidatus Arthromitus sp. SFB-rat-Yit]|uniref:translation elongation factor Ts n=1 Tax=Candidatus Arthromitus sp. SFB-rat-Yit TaxID=1041504 RepID=UPI000227A773|nr:translation elongation factor Ts [Candidatus Arthromitus sp. SFB-rat-Yit]BAK81163.1 elongation factor Ts [Candidatus Arthromitus sp. SFB-rat-Yit]